MKIQTYFLVLVALLIFSCTKIDKGILSPGIRFLQTNYTFEKGWLVSTDALNSNGSSLPVSAAILHVYDSKGNVVDTMFNINYPIDVWIAPYDPTVDTTLAAINAKRELKMMPAVNINPLNGQITGNYNTVNIPADTYSFDIKVSNLMGSEVLKNIVSITFVDTTTYQTTALGAPYDHLLMVGNESVAKTAAAPNMTVNYVADTGNTEIIVMYKDKTGAYFDPLKGEIQPRPNTGLNPIPAYLQSFEIYTPFYTYTDTSMVYICPTNPFPLTSQGNGLNVYYRIPTQYFIQDSYPADTYSANIRYAIQVYSPGKYYVTLQLPDVTRVP
jgi:hypothetical protein